jgi:uncharacterized protein (DUF58 family)
MTAAPLLDPAVVHRLGRLRLSLRRRIDGRFAGGHPARGYGSSQDFTDYREYVPGDDPRLLDPHAWARHGKLLMRRYAAEDTAAVRIVVDDSRSMAFSGKALAARRVAAALGVVALSGGDRVRVALAGERVTMTPWYGGRRGMAALLRRLEVEATGDRGPHPASPAPADLVAALDRVRRHGPRGPVIVISDLLTPGWEQVVAHLGAGRSDALLLHLLGRDEVEPAVTGDVRLVDAETGADVDLAVDAAALTRYRVTRDAWFDAVARACGGRAVGQARHVADEPVEALVAVHLRRLGWVV